MKLWNNLSTLWILSLISIFGIIMMLLFDGLWDWIMLVVIALPLLFAIYRAYKRSRM